MEDDDDILPPPLVSSSSSSSSSKAAAATSESKPFPVIALMSLATIMRQMIPFIKSEAQYISLGAIVRYLEKVRSNASECNRLGYVPISDALMEKIVAEQQRLSSGSGGNGGSGGGGDLGDFKMELYTGQLTVGDIVNMFDDNHIALIGSILFSGKDAFMNSPHIVIHCDFLRLFMTAAAAQGKRSSSSGKWNQKIDIDIDIYIYIFGRTHTDICIYIYT